MAGLGVVVFAATTGFVPGGAYPSWQLTDTGVTARFRGLAPVSAEVAWVAGSEGTILRTTDGGKNWASVGPAGTGELQFRDIEAFDAEHAVALTIGEGEDSRVYATSDGGTTWTESFRNTEPTAFYDCLTFLDAKHGMVLSDPVDGKFRILATSDGGVTWAVQPTAGMPAALDGEFAFAASGTCLVSSGGKAFFATGGGATARVFSSANFGRTWSVTDTPIPSGPSAGVYSLAMRDSRHGIAVGGDYAVPQTAPDGSATTADGGRTWTLSGTVPGEYRSGAAYVDHQTAIAVGPTGSDLSRDGGKSWFGFDTGSYDAVECVAGSCWASGEQGRVAVLAFRRSGR